VRQGLGVSQHPPVDASLPAWTRPGPLPQLPPGIPCSPAHGSQLAPELSPTQDGQNALPPPYPPPRARSLLPETMKFPLGIVNSPEKVLYSLL